ncbi:hypothetical protein [Salegentibacter sp. F14]
MYKEYSGGLVAELCSHQSDAVNWVLDAVPQQVIEVWDHRLLEGWNGGL